MMLSLGRLNYFIDDKIDILFHPLLGSEKFIPRTFSADCAACGC
jgi:hypothetical protein